MMNITVLLKLNLCSLHQYEAGPAKTLAIMTDGQPPRLYPSQPLSTLSFAVDKA